MKVACTMKIQAIFMNATKREKSYKKGGKNKWKKKES